MIANQPDLQLAAAPAPPPPSAMSPATQRRRLLPASIRLFSSLFFLLLIAFFPVSISLPLIRQQAPGGEGSSPEPEPEPEPAPAPWPLQFHALLFMNYSGALSMIDLWYDWPNGRNFNIMRDQLAAGKVYDLEWNNGTSFVYTLDGPSLRCTTAQLDVGILRPDWLDGARYLGLERVDGGFLCHVWEKADFIRYYEDVNTKRPVGWVFYTGRTAHVMSFDVGAVLEDAGWQAPPYCFKGSEEEEEGEGETREAARSAADSEDGGGGLLQGEMEMLKARLLHDFNKKASM